MGGLPRGAVAARTRSADRGVADRPGQDSAHAAGHGRNLGRIPHPRRLRPLRRAAAQAVGVPRTLQGHSAAPTTMPTTATAGSSRPRAVISACPTCAAASWWATTSAMPTTAATARWAARRNTRSPSMRCPRTHTGRIFGPEVTAAGAAAATTPIPRPCRGMTARRLRNDGPHGRRQLAREPTALLHAGLCHADEVKFLSRDYRMAIRVRAQLRKWVRPGNVPNGRAVLGPLRQLLP